MASYAAFCRLIVRLPAKDHVMRLPPISPERLTAEQRPLFDEMSEGVGANALNTFGQAGVNELIYLIAGIIASCR